MPQATDTKNKPILDKAQIRILVVDDEAHIRSALSRILTLEGYVATEASSGPEALRMLTQTIYNLLILDMQMPGMTGVEVMEQIRQRFKNIHIIILTGNATLESAIAAAKSEQVVDYLIKPAKNEAIVKAVNHALQKHTEAQHRQKLLDAASQMLSIMGQTVSSDTDSQSLDSDSLDTDQDSSRYLNVFPLQLDYQRRLVIMEHKSAEATELTESESAILSAFMKHPGEVLSCQQIVQYAMGYDEVDTYEAENLIRPYISRLRHKLETDPKKPTLICTVRRRGYVFGSAESD